MEINLEKKRFNNNTCYVFENDKIIFGYTEGNFDKRIFDKIYNPLKILELTQTHSDIVFHSSQIKDTSEGDGIILDQQNTMAIIRTADCTPLFYFSSDYRTGGIIHIGWKGLLSGIQNKIFSNIDMDISKLIFFIGPSIEKKCYEVGIDLYEQFSEKKYHQNIFFKKKKNKYLMDVNLGITLSLLDREIKKDQISYSEKCTFCNPRLNSYRRDKTKFRNYNFMILKG